MKLNVYFGNIKTGSLFSTENRGIVFTYDTQYLSDKNARQLSASLPLRQEEYSQKECMPFFSGLLPEEDARKRIADYLHVSETSTLRLLEALGGECAGVISIIPEQETVPQKDVYDFNEQNYTELSDETIGVYIQKIPERPLIKTDDKLRLSLAGAQEKLSLAKLNGTWYLPLNGAPSTHILKPAREGSLSTLAQNEYICMKLAKCLGLDVPDVDIARFAGKDVFIAARYDRLYENGTIKRMHQEDFCQALALMSTDKYQSDGGPGIADIFDMIKNVCTVPAIETRKFLRSIVFNYLVGNCDAHGKNYSLLYKGTTVSLAPLYDVLSTTVYTGFTDKLSMKIGRHYEIKKVTEEDFASLSQSLGIKASVIPGIFADFSKKIAVCTKKLEADERIDKELLHQILSGVGERAEIFYRRER